MELSFEAINDSTLVVKEQGGSGDALVKDGILIRVPKGFDSLTKDYFRVAVLDREANQALLSSLKGYFEQ